MKTLQDLFGIMAEAVERQNNKFACEHWFFSYSGHVNQLTIRFYSTGWNADREPSAKADFYLKGPEEITAAYYLIKTNL
jgi:hypothetical protein